MSDILRDVRVCMDHNMQSKPLVASVDMDTLQTNDIIRSKVLDAVRMVEMAAPARLIENGHCFSHDEEGNANDVYWSEDCAGWLLLPDDFMRLVTFKMSDWQRACPMAITEDDAKYKLQRSSVKGLRGNPERPVCAVVDRPEGKALEFYSCKNEDATVERAVYLPYPSIDKDGGVDISEHCYGSIVYMTSGLALATMGEAQLSTEMINLSKETLT